MPSPGGICCHLPPLAAALRGDVDEVARGHMPQRPNASRSWNRRTLGSSRWLLRRSSVYSLKQSSTRPCCSRRPGAALGACCALRRTLLCDGKLLSPERRCAAKRTSRCDELSWFCRIDFELPSAVPAVWSAKNRTTQRRLAPVAARCQLHRRARLPNRRRTQTGGATDLARGGAPEAPATQAEALTTRRRLQRATQS